MMNNSKTHDVLDRVHEQQIASFHHDIERQRDQGVDLLEAIVGVCEKHQIEVEECIPLLSNKLISELHKTCHNNNLLGRKATSIDLTDHLFEA